MEVGSSWRAPKEERKERKRAYYYSPLSMRAAIKRRLKITHYLQQQQQQEKKTLFAHDGRTFPETFESGGWLPKYNFEPVQEQKQMLKVKLAYILSQIIICG